MLGTHGCVSGQNPQLARAVSVPCELGKEVEHQAPPSMGFSRQEYWSGVPVPSPSSAYSLSKFPFPALQLTLSASVFNCCLKLVETAPLAQGSVNS